MFVQFLWRLIAKPLIWSRNRLSDRETAYFPRFQNANQYVNELQVPWVLAEFLALYAYRTPESFKDVAILEKYLSIFVSYHMIHIVFA